MHRCVKKQGLYEYPYPPVTGSPVDKKPPAAGGISAITSPCSWGTIKKKKNTFIKKVTSPAIPVEKQLQNQ